MPWFAVRHVVEHAHPTARLYEERVTLWDASSHEEAIERAEHEVADYAHELGGASPLDLYQSFELLGPPADGLEVFSLMRHSELAPETYVETFFERGDEREGTS